MSVLFDLLVESPTTNRQPKLFANSKMQPSANSAGRSSGDAYPSSSNLKIKTQTNLLSSAKERENKCAMWITLPTVSYRYPSSS